MSRACLYVALGRVLKGIVARGCGNPTSLSQGTVEQHEQGRNQVSL